MNAADDALLDVRQLRVWHSTRPGILRRQAGALRAVDGVDLHVNAGETLGLVGESGCGKSTLARTLVRLHRPTGGEIRFKGQNINDVRPAAAKVLTRQIQIIFQDSVSSFNPGMRVGEIVGEGLAIHGMRSLSARRELVAAMLGSIGLRPEAIDRYPHEFSGGQRQRIGIARALIMKPALVVADEPVSALDVSIQSQVLNLLVGLKREFNLALIFVAHNLTVVSYISDRIAVMYLGKIVEVGPARHFYERALHPYTRALVSAIPRPEPVRRHKRIILSGEIPSPLNPPSGCRFRGRCPIARPVCAQVEPPMVEGAPGHLAACHFIGTPLPDTSGD